MTRQQILRNERRCLNGRQTINRHRRWKMWATLGAIRCFGRPSKDPNMWKAQYRIWRMEALQIQSTSL